MVSITPAPVTEFTRPDNTVFSSIVCPECKKRQQYDLPAALLRGQAVRHKCNQKKIFFLNGYAMEGVSEYNATEKNSRAVK